MKLLHWWVWICDCHVVVNLCTLNTQAVWVSHCVNRRSPQTLMNASLFSPSGADHTSSLTHDYMEDHLLRIFSCRQDTPEFHWFSRTVEDTLYRHCDYKIKQQDPWRFHDTRDKKNHLQIVNSSSLFELQLSKIYFHFLNDSFKNGKRESKRYAVFFFKVVLSFLYWSLIFVFFCWDIEEIRTEIDRSSEIRQPRVHDRLSVLRGWSFWSSLGMLNRTIVFLQVPFFG